MGGKRRESYLEEAMETSGILVIFYILSWVVVIQILVL